MSKAARKLKRKRAKEKREPNKPFDGVIQLANPETDHFETYIAGNAARCERVAEIDSAKGQHLILCGAGPSLRDHAAKWCRKGDQIWGCNSALTWLYDHGHKPTHGFTVDQTPAMCNEWASAPDVEYLIASTSHPYLVDMLEEKGRRIRWFNNYVGLTKPPVAYCKCGHDKVDHDEACTKCDDCDTYAERIMGYEDWMYAALYPPTIRAGSGLNAVTRAIDVASFMGFTKITVLGADCAIRVKRPLPDDVMHGSPEHYHWLEHDTEMHADGGNALASGATPVTMGSYIDCWRDRPWRERLLTWPWTPWKARAYGPRWWETKPDMAISALWLVKMGKSLGPGFQLIGDTLPNALKDKPEEFLERLPALIGRDGEPIQYPTPE